MSAIDPNMPAFPRDHRHDGHNGLTIRQHYAGQILAALCANPGGPFQASEMSGWSITNSGPRQVAYVAVEMADALIAELESTEPRP